MIFKTHLFQTCKHSDLPIYLCQSFINAHIFLLASTAGKSLISRNESFIGLPNSDYENKEQVNQNLYFHWCLRCPAPVLINKLIDTYSKFSISSVLYSRGAHSSNLTSVQSHSRIWAQRIGLGGKQQHVEYQG